MDKRKLFMDKELAGTSEAASCCTDLLNQAASATLKYKQKPYKGNMRHKTWYDSRLKDLRNSLDMCCKRLSLDPFNRELQQRCFVLSKRYTKLR